MTLILCVEDEAALRADIVAELRDAGYEVREAPDGVAALNMLAEIRPDLILCDITMPRMDGFELLAAVRDQHPDCAAAPFVFLTALADREHIIEGKRRGVDDYLTKPIDFDLMLATLEARLRDVARVREHAAARSHDAIAAAIPERSSKALLGVLDSFSIGVVLLDHESLVEQCSQTAYALLGPVGVIANGRFRAAFSELSNALRTKGEAGALGGAASWLREHGAGRVLVSVCARPGGAMLLLRDPDATLRLPVARVGATLGLTPAEVRIATGLLEGKDLKTIAAEGGVAESTARTQLKAVLSKTNTHRQPELVSLMWRMLLPDNHGS